MTKSSDGVAGLIEEYLQYFGFTATLKSLREERKKSRHTDNSPSGSTAHQFIKAFDKGDHSAFFGLWEKHIPARVRRDDSTARKLAFYCQVHFAIFPLRSSGSSATSMKRFKTYLETSGLELAKAPEFLPFYALPFVDNAKEHPTFKELLTSKWESEVRSRASRFVQAVLKQEASQSGELPSLLGIVEGHKLGGAAGDNTSSTINQLRERVIRYENEMMDAKRKCMETQMCAHGLLKTTFELLQTLERASRGESIDTSVLRLHFTEVSRQAEFLGSPSLSKAAPAITNSSRQPAAQPQPQPNLPAPPVMPPSVVAPPAAPALAPLNHAKLHESLANADDNTRCRLLQALRWRLSRSQRAVRKHAVNDYVASDLLQLKHPQAASSCMQLLKVPDLLTREYVARLLNVIAAEKEGRQYLLSEQGTMCTELVSSLRALDDTDDGLLKQNLLGSLVKLSLHREPQSQMIEQGMLQWVLNQLKDIDNLSEYSQECSAALLMNLSLRTAGKKACEEPSLNVIKVLSDLLEHESMGLRTYINGTLYSLLTRPRLREAAQALGLEDILKTLDLAGDEDFARQIRYIQQQLHSDALDNAESDANEDEDEEEDEEEEDMEEEEETLEAQDGAPVGEKLLCSDYLAAAHHSPAKALGIKPQAVKAPGTQSSALARTMPRPTTPGVAQATVPNTPFRQKQQPKAGASAQNSPGSEIVLSSCRAPMPDEETIEKVKAKMEGSSGEQDMSAEFVQAFEMRSKIVRTPL